MEDPHSHLCKGMARLDLMPFNQNYVKILAANLRLILNNMPKLLSKLQLHHQARAMVNMSTDSKRWKSDFKSCRGKMPNSPHGFQQAGDRLQNTEATMGAMQQTVNTHQHEIHALGSTFQATMKNVKDDLSSEMTGSFTKQLSRLEVLFEKKQRQA
jgi:hypothetical protein